MLLLAKFTLVSIFDAVDDVSNLGFLLLNVGVIDRVGAVTADAANCVAGLNALGVLLINYYLKK